MSSWTIGKRLVFGFAAIVVVLIAVGVFAVMTTRSIKVDADSLAKDSMPGLAMSGELLVQVEQNTALLLKGVHADTLADVEQVEAGFATQKQEIDKILNEYAKTINAADDRVNFDAIAPARAKYLEVRNAAIGLRKTSGEKAAGDLYKRDAESAIAAYLASVQKVRDWNVKAGEASSVKIETAIASAMFWVPVLVLVGVLMAGLLGWVIVRSTTGVLSASVNELRSGSEQVTAAATQVASSAQSLSQGSTEQAASLEETSASMEEIASMTNKNAQASQQAATLVASVASQVENSNVALGEMVASMSAISESSNKVAKIIKTIDEIAFQTNILALNAAVEAARAGEAGMGFAVVADEVRSLAQRSAQAAKDTAGLIEESIARSQEGSVKVEQVAASISTITTSVREVNAIVSDVREASQQQMQGMSQVSQAIQQMEKVTQTTAATAEESAAAAEELNAQAETSMQVVQRLSALVGGATATVVSHSAPARTSAHKPAKPVGRVVSMTPRAGKPSAKPTAEELLPLDDTGTFGKF